MSKIETAVLIVKKGDVAPATRDALRRIGVYVVESDDPASVRFLKPNAELSASDLAYAALKAMHVPYASDESKKAFTAEVWRMVKATYETAHPTPAPSEAAR